MIHSSELSFVVIGDPNDIHTDLSLQSIVDNFPEAEIIISTTIAPKKDISDRYIVCLNGDPGELIDDKNKHEANKNLNRLICNSYLGTRVATRKYVVRTRNDIFFKNNALIKEYELFSRIQKRNLKYKICDSKILVSNIWTIHPFSSLGLCFHPSDWVMMAPKDVILEYYNIPYKSDHHISDDNAKLFHRNEQYQFISNIQKFIPNLDIEYDLDPKLRSESLRFLMHNFYIDIVDRMGFICLKHPLVSNDVWNYKDYLDFLEDEK